MDQWEREIQDKEGIHPDQQRLQDEFNQQRFSFAEKQLEDGSSTWRTTTEMVGSTNRDFNAVGCCTVSVPFSPSVAQSCFQSHIAVSFDM